jgi:hypothetical protein
MARVTANPLDVGEPHAPRFDAAAYAARVERLIAPGSAVATV